MTIAQKGIEGRKEQTVYRHVFGSDEVADLVMRVIGEIEPVGETYTDDARLVHLQILLNTLDVLIDEVMIDVLPCESRPEYSMQRAGEEALKWVEEKCEQFMEEVAERKADDE